MSKLQKSKTVFILDELPNRFIFNTLQLFFILNIYKIETKLWVLLKK